MGVVTLDIVVATIDVGVTGTNVNEGGDGVATVFARFVMLLRSMLDILLATAFV